MKPEEILSSTMTSGSDTENENLSVASPMSYSDLADVSVVSKQQKTAAKKWKKEEEKKKKKLEKKKRKNKISKEDFYSKSLELRIWLLEEKNVKVEHLSPGHQKHFFKKFVKKWNNRKLPQKYYRGLDMWAEAGTPTGQLNWTLPGHVEVTPGSIPEEALMTQYARQLDDVQFGTFGRKRGAKTRATLQAMESRYNSEHVYAEPVSPRRPAADLRVADLRGDKAERDIADLEELVPPPEDSILMANSPAVGDSERLKQSDSQSDGVFSPAQVAFKVHQTAPHITPGGNLYQPLTALNLAVSSSDPMVHMVYLDADTPLSAKPKEKPRTRKRSKSVRKADKEKAEGDPVYCNLPPAKRRSPEGGAIGRSEYVAFQPRNNKLLKRDSYAQKLMNVSPGVLQTMTRGKTAVDGERGVTPVRLSGYRQRLTTPAAKPTTKPTAKTTTKPAGQSSPQLTPGKTHKPTPL